MTACKRPRPTSNSRPGSWPPPSGRWRRQPRPCATRLRDRPVRFAAASSTPTACSRSPPVGGTLMPDRSYDGLLLIGDPHLESRQPGFRKDDYPNVILEKLAWCLDYAANNCLLPAILGDLFDKPRDNPNWMLARLLDLLRGEILCLYGNHDCADPELSDHDSLSLLIKAGRLKLLSAADVWQGAIAGRTTVVGGSSYREKIPKRYERPDA